MELQIESIRSVSDSRLSEIHNIYCPAFPADEQRPWASLLDKVADGEISLYVALVGENVAGMATVWHMNGFRYIEHLAVDQSLRGHGLGAVMVRWLLAAENSPVVLEAEPRGLSAMAARRIGFYERLGFTAHHDYCYIQPPYTPDSASVPLTLMTAGEPVPDLDEVTLSLHRRVYGVR